MSMLINKPATFPQSENDFETHEEKMSVNSLGAVSLHALSYDHRDEADQYGVLYSGLNSCQVSSWCSQGGAVRPKKQLPRRMQRI